MRFDHEELFKELAKSYGINLFLGAGFSVYAYNNNDESLPLGDDINQRLIKLFSLDNNRKLNLSKTCQKIKLDNSDILEKELKEIYTVKKFDEEYYTITKLPIKNIVTINIDNLLEKIYDSPRSSMNLSDTTIYGSLEKEKAVSLYKLHGSVTYPIGSRMSFTETELTDLFIKDSKLFELVSYKLSTAPTIFWGTSKIKDVEPYKDNLDCKSYFDFLDYYNMKINNNQTKGIVTGVFSSTVSAELLMLCVDYEIKNIIGDDVTYIRYVDDMTFFSDSLEEIYAKLPLVQRVLNKYRLRINNNKTEAQKSIYNMSYVDMYEVKHRFEFFDFDSSEKVKYNKEVFYNIKGYVARIYDNNQKSEIKAFLSMFRRAIISGKLDFDEEEKIDLKTHTIAYMLQLACLEPIFASRCYRVIIEILDLINKDDRKDEIITLLKSKNEYINSTYHDSLLQIWHYYVLSKYDNTRIKEYIETYHYRYAMEIEKFQETSQIALDDLRENVPGFVAPQMYIYLDNTELLEYIDSNLKMADLQVKHLFERIEACQVCKH